MTQQEQQIRQKLEEIRDRLLEISALHVAALLDNDLYLAHAYAKEGEAVAALGYEWSCRLSDLLEPAGEYPEAVRAVEEILGLDATNQEEE